jgi:CspA family cold shock protein
MQTQALPVRAVLKWFNGPKGFGFVNPCDDARIDAFLHITILQKADVQILGDEAVIECVIDYTDRGAMVREVVQIVDPGTLPKGVQCHRMPQDSMVGQTFKMGGLVKWYKKTKGFGFIVPDDGKKDVFVHESCLERHDIETLQSGQRVSMEFRSVPKGRELISLSFEPAES